MKIKTDLGVFTPADTNHLGSGGEAAVYGFKTLAVKIAHSPDKLLPEGKVRELMAIQDARVIRPNGVAYNADTGAVVGYTMPKLDSSACETACAFFPPDFRRTRSLSTSDMLAVGQELKAAITSVHAAKCLVVDLNELNILIRSFAHPLLIDTDSFQTPSFPATAIMASIRDMTVQHQKWTTGSDWFSFSIILFQLLFGIHPYKGGHSRYAIRDWQKRMTDKVSVFDKEAKLPAMVPPFTIIDLKLRNYFEGVFQWGDRGLPPNMDATLPQPLPTQLSIMKSSGKFKNVEVLSYSEPVVDVAYYLGDTYVLTTTSAYVNGKAYWTNYKRGNNKATVYKIVPSIYGPIKATVLPGSITFEDFNGFSVTLPGKGLFVRQDCAYTVIGGWFMEVRFTEIGGKLHTSTKGIENVLPDSTKIYDGCAVQTIMKTVMVALPYAAGASRSVRLPELEGYRIVDVAARCNLAGTYACAVVVAEKAGRLDNFRYSINIFMGTVSWCVITEDIAYAGINLALAASNTIVTIDPENEGNLLLSPVQGTQRVELIPQPPIGYSMKLFTTNRGTYFVNGSSIHKMEVIR